MTRRPAFRGRRDAAEATPAVALPRDEPLHRAARCLAGLPHEVPGRSNEYPVAQIRPGYIVLLEQNLYIHEPPAESRRLIGEADLGVTPSSQPAGGPAAAAVLDPPAQVEIADVEVERIPYLEVRERKGRKLIAVIGLLSPSNKRGEDRDQYLAKRGRLLRTSAHFVEIDLLRDGPPMPAEDRPACVYSVLVSRAGDRPRAGFWPIGLRDRLPEIPVPLRAPHADARLDLQAALHRVYDFYGYQDFLYDDRPDPPLPAEDEAWVRSVLGPGAA